MLPHVQHQPLYSLTNKQIHFPDKHNKPFARGATG